VSSSHDIHIITLILGACCLFGCPNEKQVGGGHDHAEHKLGDGHDHAAEESDVHADTRSGATRSSTRDIAQETVAKILPILPDRLANNCLTPGRLTWRETCVYTGMLPRAPVLPRATNSPRGHARNHQHPKQHRCPSDPAISLTPVTYDDGLPERCNQASARLRSGVTKAPRAIKTLRALTRACARSRIRPCSWRPSWPDRSPLPFDRRSDPF